MKRFTVRGYPGNEDSGAMGSWYVFSAMGFFPNAGQDRYLINGPKFRKVILWMGKDKRLVIEGRNASEANVYVQSAKLNGKPLSESGFIYADIKRGGTLVFEMGPQPSNWGKWTGLFRN